MFCSICSCPYTGWPTSCEESTCSANTLGAGSFNFLVVGSAAATGIIFDESYVIQIKKLVKHVCD